MDAVSVYFRDLQAGGKPETTIRSYGMDLLRWFRFLWAIDVPWQRVSRVEARDFLAVDDVGGQACSPALATTDRGSENRATPEALLDVGASS